MPLKDIQPINERLDIVEYLISHTEIKQLLEEDVFGHSIDYYYKLKHQAQKGDENAQRKMNKLRESFNESLQAGTMIHWN